MSSSAFEHQPVMFDEVMDAFAPIKSGVIVDGTLGGGGHSEGILKTGPLRLVLGIDRDQSAVDAAEERLRQYSKRFRSIRTEFDRFDQALSEACASDERFCESPIGLLLDLGVSSHQLESPERGFSYRHEGPLDMRMDPTTGQSASEYLDVVSIDELAALLRANGESRFARRIARAILDRRPYFSTVQLAEVVKNSIPAAARRTGGHPATRVFQALRVKVNNELERLQSALEKAFKLVAPSGRIAVLSYHSGEDSIVKALFRNQVTGGCTCPPKLGCVCGAVPKARYVVRSKAPSSREIEENPRSRSARLRVIEMIAGPRSEEEDG